MLKAPADSLVIWHFPFSGTCHPPLSPLVNVPPETQGKFPCWFFFFGIIHRLSHVSVPSLAHTSPTSPFLLPLSFICLDNFQESWNSLFAISFNNFGKVGFCHTSRLACFTKSYQKFLLCSFSFSVTCGLPDLPQQHLLFSAPVPGAGSWSLQTLWPSREGRQGWLSAGGSCW